MLPSRIMLVWIGLVLAFAISMVLPVYGTGGEKEKDASHKEPKAESQEPVEATEHKDQKTDPMTSSQESTASEEASPELTLVEKLQARLQQLEEREQRIQDDEQRLGALRQDVEKLAARQEKAIAEALAIREAQKAAKKEDPSQESLKHLIKVYEAMDPEEAALRISKMEESLALDILAGIKDKKAAGMLAGVEPTKAAKLSKGLRNYHKRKQKM